jgi:hypothetical protein
MPRSSGTGSGGSFRSFGSQSSTSAGPALEVLQDVLVVHGLILEQPLGDEQPPSSPDRQSRVTGTQSVS